MNKFMYKYKDSFHYILFILFLFFFSNLLPWTNPYPLQGVYKPIEDLVFFWQYNSDTPGEILSSFYFPEYFEKNPNRMERPGYLLPSLLFGKILNFFLHFIGINISEIYPATLGYLLTKLLFYFISISLCVKLYEIYFDKNISKILVFIFFLGWESVRQISQLHTTEFQFLFPIISTYILIKLNDSTNLQKILLIILMGYLITVKHNFAIILTILTFLLIKKKFKETILFIILLSIFPLIYLIYIKFIANYEIYFHLFQSDHQYGSWILNSDLKIIFIKFIRSILVFFKYNIDYYFIFLIPFIIFIFDKNSYSKYKNEILFSFLLIFFTLVQGYAANKFGRFTFNQMTYHTRAYMVGDYAFIIFASFGFLLKKNYTSIKKYIPIIFIVWIGYTSIFFINLPWKHPFDQKTRDWKYRIQNLDK